MPALIDTPSENPDAWNNLVIDNAVAPGAPTIIVDRGVDLDRKKPGSGNKGTLTVNGVKLIEFDITLTIWEDANDDVFSTLLEQTRALLAKLFPDKGVPGPFRCEHPILLLHNVKAMFFEGSNGPSPAGPGIWQTKLKAVEFNPTKNVRSATSTAKGTRPGNAIIPTTSFKSAFGLNGFAVPDVAYPNAFKPGGFSIGSLTPPDKGKVGP